MRSASAHVQTLHSATRAPAGTSRRQSTRDEWPADEEGSAVRPIAQTGYTRVRYVVESRHAVLELRPATPHYRNRAPLPDPRRIDVNDAHLETLLARTHAVSTCPACSGPGAPCAVCFGSATVEAWISVRTTRRYAVVIQGQGAALERHAGVNDPADFDRTEFPNHLLHQAWYRSIPPQLAAALRLQPAAHERIEFVHVQVFIG